MCPCGTLEDLPKCLFWLRGPKLTLLFRLNFQSFTILKLVFEQQVVDGLLPKPNFLLAVIETFFANKPWEAEDW